MLGCVSLIIDILCSLLSRLPCGERETWNWSMELRSGGGGQHQQPWWRVCLVHGDQHKFYRQLYGHKRAAIRTHIR